MYNICKAHELITAGDTERFEPDRHTYSNWRCGKKILNERIQRYTEHCIACELYRKTASMTANERWTLRVDLDCTRIARRFFVSVYSSVSSEILLL